MPVHANRTGVVLTAGAILLLASAFLMTTTGVWGAPPFQGDPTEQQQTIDAVVNQFFTQTAEVDQLLGATQTVEAAFNQAQTGTAAFQMAIYDSFNQALTATAQASLEARGNELGLEPITAGNAARLTELVRIGRGRLSGLAWSPDGQSIALARSTGVWIHDSHNLEEVKVRLDIPGARAVAFSSDGARLASASADGTVRLWDPATGAALAVLQGHESYVSSVAFSPDGARLASASLDGTVRLWDPATGAALAVLQGHEYSVESIAFSSDGLFVASAGYDGTIRSWGVLAGERAVQATATAAAWTPSPTPPPTLTPTVTPTWTPTGTLAPIYTLTLTSTPLPATQVAQAVEAMILYWDPRNGSFEDNTRVFFGLGLKKTRALCDMTRYRNRNCEGVPTGFEIGDILVRTMLSSGVAASVTNTQEMLEDLESNGKSYRTLFEVCHDFYSGGSQCIAFANDTREMRLSGSDRDPWQSVIDDAVK